MNDNSLVVYIVDDDEAVRDSLHELLESVEIESQGFSSAQDFLDNYNDDMEGCCVLDIRMPGMSGLELHRKLLERECKLPVVFLTGHGDVPMAVDAMKQGAMEFIQKPVRDQELLDCINAALDSSRKNQRHHSKNQKTRDRLSTLTPREREVLDLVVDGNANKVIAGQLGISQRTVEIHRAHIMDKMGARSSAKLVKMIVQLNMEDSGA